MLLLPPPLFLLCVRRYVYYAGVELDPDPDAAKDLLFVLKIRRNAASTVFKTLIPMIANALVITLTTTMGNNPRLKVIVASTAGAIIMLNPTVLGLPSNVQGVPFLQSIVIIHIVISLVLLLYTLRCFVIDKYYESTLIGESKNYHASSTGVWKKHAAVHTKWADALADQSLSAQSPPPAMPRAGQPPLAQGQVHVTVDDPAGPSKPSQEEEGGFDTQRAIVELLVALPSLFHRQDPTRPPTIWTPFGVPQPQIMPKYGKALATRKKIDRQLVWIVPLLASVLTLKAGPQAESRLTGPTPSLRFSVGHYSQFLFAWSIDLVIYFGVTPSEPQ